jgi:hypothetical protein
MRHEKYISALLRHPDGNFWTPMLPYSRLDELLADPRCKEVSVYTRSSRYVRTVRPESREQQP